MSPAPWITRRQWQRLCLAGTGVAMGTPWLNAVSGVAQERTASAPLPLNRFSRMVQEYFVEQLKGVEARGAALRAALTTKQDAE